jgi:hypothetical protein
MDNKKGEFFSVGILGQSSYSFFQMGWGCLISIRPKTPQNFPSKSDNPNIFLCLLL